jgi:predicted nicotinamide N-methyase
VDALQTNPDSACDRRYHRLLARIQRKYQTTTEDLRFGDITIRFTRVADPDLVLDEIVAEEDRREKISGVRLQDPLHLPYWAELWESALGIAGAMTAMQIAPGTRVLDLGCGMGLAGAAAASMEAHVMLADLEAPALLFARLNCVRFGPKIRVRRLNWQVDRLGERFDLILGADILYERKQWEFLDAFWKEHLADGGSVLLGEPGRQSGELFVPWIAQQGWDLRETAEQIAMKQKPVRIFRLHRKTHAQK